MNLLDLILYDFRNYAQQQFTFHPGTNLIVGENAQGKTNLLEAVFYLSTGKSFRTANPQELIRFGCTFAEMSCRLQQLDRQQELKTVLFASRRPRQIFIGGVKQKSAAGLSGQLQTVLFCPEDLNVLKGGASGRRKLMDTALCQLRPGYEKALSEYQKLYQNKTRILKDYREMPSLLEPLPEFNQRMAQMGAIIISTRAKYIKKLEEAATSYHLEFSGGKEELTLQYQTVSTIDDPFAAKTELYERLMEHQAAHYRAELESGQCLTGPHKDDFDAALNGVSVKAFASQGQTRTAAISLKLAERAIFQADTGEEPVLLLDDVLSELDEKRQDFVLNRITTGQVFITCCESQRLTGVGKCIRVENGRAF